MPVARQNTNIAEEVRRAQQSLSFFYLIFKSSIFGGTTTMSGSGDITTAVRGALVEIGNAEGIQLEQLSLEVRALLGGTPTPTPTELQTYDYGVAGSPLGTSGAGVNPSANAIVWDLSTVTDKTGWVQIGMQVTHTGGLSEVGITFWDDPDQASPSVSNARVVAQTTLPVSQMRHQTIRVWAKDGKVSFTIAGAPTNTVNYTLSLFAV